MVQEIYMGVTLLGVVVLAGSAVVALLALQRKRRVQAILEEPAEPRSAEGTTLRPEIIQHKDIRASDVKTDRAENRNRLLPRRRRIGLGDGSPYNSPRKALRFARKLGEEKGWLLASNAPDTVGALEPILSQRLALLAEGMTERRRALREQQSNAINELGKIKAADPLPLPVLQNRWVLAGVLLFLAALEAIMAYPALGAFQEFADGGAKQWLVAVLVGLLLALILLATARGLAYVLKQPAHSHTTNRHWLVVWPVTGLAFLGVVCILILPVFLTVSQEYNVAVVMGITEETGQGPDQGPNLTWTLVLQLAALIAGLISSTLWALGEEYRRYARLEEAVEAAHARLEALDSNERVQAEDEIAAGAFRYYEYFRYRERGAVEAGQKIPPAAIQPPDREFWLKEYYSMTHRPEELAREPAESEDRQDTA